MRLQLLKVMEMEVMVVGQGLLVMVLVVEFRDILMVLVRVLVMVVMVARDDIQWPVILVAGDMIAVFFHYWQGVEGEGVVLQIMAREVRLVVVGWLCKLLIKSCCMVTSVWMVWTVLILHKQMVSVVVVEVVVEFLSMLVIFLVLVMFLSEVEKVVHAVMVEDREVEVELVEELQYILMMVFF